MKKILTLCAIMLYATLTLTAQPPQAMKYMAIAKDEWGVALPSKEISLRFTIYWGSEYGTTVYIETHQVTTNKFGLMDVNIGEGTPQTGIFSNIDWGAGDYYLKIELDPKGGDDYRLEDESHQLLSVPYALYAGSVLENDDNDSDPANELNSSLELNGTNLELTDAGGTLVLDLSALTVGDGGQYFYADKDGDGYGYRFNTVYVPDGVAEPADFILDNTDCNDENSAINPGTAEIEGDGIDNNCDGVIDVIYTDPDVDDDEDGYTENDNDCDDTDASIYPGATEICGDGIDQDCDGEDLLCPEVCDEYLSLSSTDPLDAARAIGLCGGVLAAQWLLPDGSTPPADPNFDLGHGILPSFGSNVSVLEGSKMLAMSTGTARQPSDPNYSDDLVKNYSHGLFPGYPIDVVGCISPSNAAYDGIALYLVLNVPAEATGFSFNYKFYSKDYPTYMCSVFSDQAVVIVNPPPATSINGNVMYDSQGSPASASSQYFITCCNPTTGTPYTCPQGTSELVGTGFDNNGGSVWLEVNVDVQPSSTIEVYFMIWDSGDAMITSTILFDNWHWITN